MKQKTQLETIPTLANTVFTSVGAYPNPEIRCRNFIKSAEKFGVPIHWISWGEQWQGFYHHKLVLFREQCKQWRENGIKYVFVLDSKDVVFADPVDIILRKAAEIYEPGTLLFNAEFALHIHPYKDEHFKAMVKKEGCDLNSGMIFGEVNAFIKVIDLTLEIFDGIRNGTPKDGIAKLVHDDPATQRMREDDQLAYQIASIYYPQFFRVDTDRYLLSWVGILDRPVAEMRTGTAGYKGIGQASLIHSSSTIQYGSPAMWDNWVAQNILNESFCETTSAVGIIVRNEAKYIEECILYNHLLGFDRIFIGCDRCEDDTYERAMKLQKHLPHLTVFEVPSKKSDDSALWYQRAGYHYIVEQLRGQVEWLAMFDCDEYLWNKDHSKINDLLKMVPSHVNQIRIPWLLFGHNNQVVSAPQSWTRLEWFTRRQPFVKEVESKVIFRLACITSENWWHPHSINERAMVNSTVSFSYRRQPPHGIMWYGDSLETEPVMLCHYQVGAMEDWVRRNKKHLVRMCGCPQDVRMFLSHGWDIDDARMQPYAEELKTLLKEYCHDTNGE